MREWYFYGAEKAAWGDGPWLAECDRLPTTLVQDTKLSQTGVPLCPHLVRQKVRGVGSDAVIEGFRVLEREFGVRSFRDQVREHPAAQFNRR